MNGVFNKLKEILIKHKKYLIGYIIITAILLVGIAIFSNNYKWYDTTIARVVKVQNSFDHESNGNKGEIEKYYKQELVGTIMNGEFKGNKVTMQNEYSSSGVFEDEYGVGDEIFITVNKSQGDTLTGIISGLKRDKYMAILFAILFILILLVAKKRGLFIIISLIVNIAVFCFALELYKKGTDILVLSNYMVIFFTSVSLLIINGFKKSTFIAILSTLISIGFTVIISRIVMDNTGGVDYGFMEYITNVDDLESIFMSQILIGGLGATMDVAITMASTISELIAKDNKISLNKLIKSGREVGHDIMGTMINVMLFTYVAGSIPMMILKMKSDIRLLTIILVHMPMEISIFLLGSIGILLTIPISLFISIIIFKKLRRAA